MEPFLFYLILGVALILIELLLFQMSVMWSLFIGFGALVAAFVAWLNPEASWLLTTGLFVLASGLISALLYRPVKSWQSKPGPMAVSDAIGQSALVLEDIAPGASGRVKWSGTEWQAEVESESGRLQQGDYATITQLNGIRLTIKKK